MYRFTSKEYVDGVTVNSNQKSKEKTSSSLWSSDCFLACLVRVRALASKKAIRRPKRRRPASADDSGSKLRDKEQQRLSSK